MKTFYVSLVRDLLGCYLAVKADSEETVRLWLVAEYFEEKTRTWKLPWCAIYEAIPDCPHTYGPVIIPKFEMLSREQFI